MDPMTMACPSCQRSIAIAHPLPGSQFRCSCGGTVAVGGSPDLAQTIAHLSLPDEAERRAAVVVLTRHFAAEAATHLRGVAEADASPQIRTLARQILAAREAADRPTGGTALAGDRERKVLSVLKEALTIPGRELARSLADIVAGATDNETRTVARELFENTRASLERLLVSPDDEMRAAAMEATATIEEPWVQSWLVKGLADPNPKVCASAARALWGVESDLAVRTLARMAHSEQVSERLSAMRACRTIAADDVLPLLRSGMTDAEAAVREMAGEAIAGLAAAGSARACELLAGSAGEAPAALDAVEPGDSSAATDGRGDSAGGAGSGSAGGAGSGGSGGGERASGKRGDTRQPASGHAPAGAPAGTLAAAAAATGQKAIPASAPGLGAPMAPRTASPAAHRERGSRALEENHLSEALVHLRLALEGNPRDVVAACLLGRVHALQGRPEQAVAMFELATATAPRDVEPRYLLARELLARDDLARAQESAEAILAVDEDHAGARHLLGVIAFKKGDMNLALEKARDALTKDPRLVDAYQLQSLVLRARGEPGLALAAARKALELRPRDIALKLDVVRACLDAGRAEEARQALDALQKEAPYDPQIQSAVANFAGLAASRADVHAPTRRGGVLSAFHFVPWLILWLGLGTGVVLSLDDPWDAAIPLGSAWLAGTLLMLALSRLADRFPRAAGFLARPLYLVAVPLPAVRGALLQVQGMEQAVRGNALRALVLLKEAIDRRPRDWRAHARLGRLLMLARQPARAAGYFKQAIDLAGQDKTLLRELGASYNADRQFDLALIPLKHAHALDEKDPRVLSELGFAYQGKRDHSVALRYLTQAFQLDEHSADTAMRLGTAYAEMGKISEARAYLERAIQLRNWDAQAYSLLGWTHNLAEQYDAAIPHLQRALEIDAGNATAYYHLGFALFKKGDLDRAARHIGIAVELTPGLAGAWRLLAGVHVAGGRMGLARQSYKRLLELDPDNAEARLWLERNPAPAARP